MAEQLPAAPVDLAPSDVGVSSSGGTELSSGRFDVTTYVLPEPVVQFARRRGHGSLRSVRRKKMSRRRRIIGRVMVVGGAALLIGSAWVGWRTYQAYTHLTAAAAAVTELQGQLEDLGDLNAIAAGITVDHLQQESAAATSAVNDPLYRLATVLPWLGDNLSAVRSVTLTVDSLATDVLPAMVDVAQTVQPSQLAPRDGTINIASIADASDTLQRADAAVRESQLVIAALDREGLVRPVFNAVNTLSDKLHAAGSVTATAARAARLLPPMLGSNGPRTYLVVFQNLAEPRATGGIFGSYALVTADRGKITLISDAASRTLGQFDPAAAGLKPEQLSLYTAEMGVYPQDVNFTPDFSAAAPLFASMYTARTGTAIDGVMAIDPVALSYMLEGTGPVDAGDGTVLTSDSVVPILLSDAYQQFADEASQKQRDSFLSSATAKAFGAVMSGQGDATAVMRGLTHAADERRVLIWSSNPTEQGDLGATALAGALSSDMSTPSIGVFLNDGTGAKLGYYLRNEVHVSPGDCQADGGRELVVSVTLNYDAPTSGLPDYVTGIGVGGHARGLPPYVLQTNVMIFAPAGGTLDSVVDSGGSFESLRLGTDQSRSVGTTTVQSEPGSSTMLVFKVTVPASSDQTETTAQLELTPGVAPWESQVDSYKGCME